MSKKKYSDHDGHAEKQPSVREAKARAYRNAKQKPIALKLGTAKRRLKKPVKRSKAEIAWALQIVGIGEGPEDLSEKMREYLYSNR